MYIVALTTQLDVWQALIMTSWRRINTGAIDSELDIILVLLSFWQSRILNTNSNVKYNIDDKNLMLAVLKSVSFIIRMKIIIQK